MEIQVEVAVVGAGVIGLAVAAELAEAGRSVLVIERQPGPGRETSSRNSEVIHSGLYYPSGSLKARLCVDGRRLLYAFCERYGVAHRRIGKLIVACSSSELSELERLHALGTANGVEGLQILDRSDLARLEPEIRGVAALHSPMTGIVDGHGLIKALEARLHAAGGLTLYRCEFVGSDPLPADQGFALRVRETAGDEVLHCRTLVNAAGLEADTASALAGRAGYQQRWCKGDYFSVGGASARLVSRLVYPLPAPHFLGIHITLDLSARMRLGPDANYIDRTLGQQPHLVVAESKVGIFSAAVQRYLPRLRTEDLQPDMVGIRPKLQGPKDTFKDFVILSEEAAGLPRLVNLIGLESPGLTSSLAVGKLVNSIVHSLDE